MKRPTPSPLSALLASFAFWGCSSSSDAPSQPSVMPVVCEAPGYYVEADSTLIEQVSATLRLPSGEAAAALPVQVCGIDVCLNYKANRDGVLNVTPRERLVRPALKYGDGFDYAELAVPLVDSKPNLGELVALPLPPLAEGAKFSRSGSVSNGDVTLKLAANTKVEHDILTYSDESELVFRSVPIPIADSAQALPPSQGFELAYGLAPLHSTFCPAAGLSVANSLNWEPATEVEVFVQGLDVNENWASYGNWVPVAEARVSSDGTSIDTTSGGIPILSSIALRRK